MPRGNGKQAQNAVKSGKLSAFVVPKGQGGNAPSEMEWVDWKEINPSLVAGTVAAVVKEGGGILFGCSRDKSSYSIKIYSGGDGTAYYFPCNANGVADLEAFLYGVLEACSD